MKRSSHTLGSIKLFPEGIGAYVTCSAILVLGILYALYIGPIALWPDSLHYADRARMLLEQGSFFGNSAYPTTAPLYSLLLTLGFAFPDMQSGHHVLVIVQALLISVSFFPLRAMLLRSSGLEARQASMLAMGALMLPCFFCYTPFISPQALVLPFLMYGAYFIDRLLAGSRSKIDGVGAGICLGLAWLTYYSAGIFWLAALVVLIPLFLKADDKNEKQAALFAAVLPAILFLPWLLMNFGKEGMDLQLSLNNALARFNFGKNAVMYLIYGGAPLAGIALILSGVLNRKYFWQNDFFRFAFIGFAALAVYAALTTDVIVDRKLDYFTNRLLEPYLFLPLIVFVRLDPTWRRDMLTNSLLLFFVMLIFGLPMSLHLDFQSGLTFWNGVGASTSAGVIRNVLYALLIAAPVGMLWWRPQWFMATYTFMLFIMVAVGLSADAYAGRQNEEGQIDSASAQSIYHNEDLRKADAIFVDHRCRGTDNNDVAYLFGCYDLTRALYFLPHLPTHVTTQELISLPPKQTANAFFASSENDNIFGPVEVQQGLARFQHLDAVALKQAARTPLVHIEKIRGMKEYISLPVMDRMQRVTMLNPQSEIDLHSSAEGCVKFQAQWFMDTHAQPVTVQLNNGPANKLTIPLIGKGPKSTQSIKLNVPQGSSTLYIAYGDPKNRPHGPSLIMFDRPVIASCGGK